MTASRGRLRRMRSRDDGFTVVEVLVAASILAIAIVLTVTPLVGAMRSLARSRHLAVAGGLAQARIEQVRALPFNDVGHPGNAPQGVIPVTEVRTVDGRDFVIETMIEFVGSISGLRVTPQGGDGVEGSFDRGVDYKYVTVVVGAVEGDVDPVRMETFLAPPAVGGLDNIAVVEVTLNRHEPYDVYVNPTPLLMIAGPSSYSSLGGTDTQYFADVTEGLYAISLFTTNGWKIHPESIATQATSVEAVAGTNVERTVRIYQPTILGVEVVAEGTSEPITDAIVTVTNTAYGLPTTNARGEYSFSGLIPDRHTIEVSAPGYIDQAVTTEVPGPGDGLSHFEVVRLVPLPLPHVEATFTVRYLTWDAYTTAGAVVTVTHPAYGTFTETTDHTGQATLLLPRSTRGWTVVASTDWGHAQGAVAYDTGTNNDSAVVSLSQLPATDRLILKDGPVGPEGFFEYQAGNDPWVRVPANESGLATVFVVEDTGTTVYLRSYCSLLDYPASPDGTALLTPSNSDWSWDAGTSC